MGDQWRKEVGLPRGGTGALITNLGVLRPNEEHHELVLNSIHPGVLPEEVIAQTGWELKVSPDLKETMKPTKEELQVIRRMDPEGFWTGNR